MKPFLVGVAGPSGAGKSTVTRLIEAKNHNVLTVNLDNYFNDIDGFPKMNGVPNWDLPSNINYELLLENLRDLKQGKSTKIPSLNKATSERIYKVVEPKEVILVEGFLLYFDEKITHLFDKKIYIDVLDRTQLERRLRRETPERAEYVQEVVIPNFKIYGLPTKKYADVVLSGDKTPEELRSEILEYVRIYTDVIIW